MKNNKQYGDLVIPVAKQLRIASLNILNSSVNAESRYERLAEEIKSIDADVVVLQECNFTDTDDLIYKLQETTDFKALHKSIDIESRHGVITSAMVTLTKDEHSTSWELPLIVSNALPKHIFEPILVTHVKFNNSDVFIFNVHLAWGGENEVWRLKQVLQIEDEIVKLKTFYPDGVFILGGDLNANSFGDVLSFLTKQRIVEGRSSFWVDAWDMFGTEDNKATSASDNLLNMRTGKGAGIQVPELIPNRRIDYLLVKGWAYGSNGSPLSFDLWADKADSEGYTISDHYGVVADFYISKD